MTQLTLADPALSDDAVTLCRGVIARHSRSFALASRLLPAGVRDEAWVVYAWCRRADDAVDEAPPAERADALTRLRSELDAVYRGDPLDDPVLQAFREVVRGRSIPRRYPEDLIDGMAMDVHGHAYRTWNDLLGYCYRVAGTVGLMMCHVMGVRREDALTNAVHLGMAMQLTNICRDVAEDWGRGRLYLPASLLEQEGGGWIARVGRGGELPPGSRLPLARAMSRLLDRAEEYYRSGDRGLAALSWRCALAVRSARHVYADIGRVLRTRGCDPTTGRAVVSRPRKVVRVLGAALRSVLEVPARLWRRMRGVGRPRLPARTVRYPVDVVEQWMGAE